MRRDTAAPSFVGALPGGRQGDDYPDETQGQDAVDPDVRQELPQAGVLTWVGTVCIAERERREQWECLVRPE